MRRIKHAVTQTIPTRTRTPRTRTPDAQESILLARCLTTDRNIADPDRERQEGITECPETQIFKGFWLRRFPGAAVNVWVCHVTSASIVKD